MYKRQLPDLDSFQLPEPVDAGAAPSSESEFPFADSEAANPESPEAVEEIPTADTVSEGGPEALPDETAAVPADEISTEAK